MKEDPIKHVVLLMLENHSFDEMLGCFQERYPHLEGVSPASDHRYNTDFKGNKYFQLPKESYSVKLDPYHELNDVKVQLANNNGGFIQNYISHYEKNHPTPQDFLNVMGYYPRGFLPALHALAEDFTICDRWFSSLPGPTWPNRLFALSGTSSGYVKMPGGLENFTFLETIEHQTQPTLFDRLNDKKKSWKIFYYDFPDSLMFANQRTQINLARYESIDQFFNADFLRDESNFPDFVFIEPKYFGRDQNDDHPPHNIMKGEKLIADVYNAIRSHDALWQSTLLMVVFDEHGGFYDHVIPPAAVPPDDQRAEYTFDQYGLRVPAILVSPWVKRGVDSTLYDHTSILKYLTDKWELGPLGKRTAQANSIEGAISLKNKRKETDTIAHIRVPYSRLIQNDHWEDEFQQSSHQEAIHQLADYIEKEVVLPLYADALTEVSRMTRLWIELQSWMGKLFYSLGLKLTEQKIQAHRLRVEKTTLIAQRLIEKSKVKTKKSKN